MREHRLQPRNFHSQAPEKHTAAMHIKSIVHVLRVLLSFQYYFK